MVWSHETCAFAFPPTARFRVASIPDGKSQFIPSEGDTERQLCTLQGFHIPEHLLGHNRETQDVCHDDVTLISAEQCEDL